MTNDGDMKRSRQSARFISKMTRTETYWVVRFLWG
jgi:hypothetical protein